MNMYNGHVGLSKFEAEFRVCDRHYHLYHLNVNTTEGDMGNSVIGKTGSLQDCHNQTSCDITYTFQKIKRTNLMVIVAEQICECNKELPFDIIPVEMEPDPAGDCKKTRRNVERSLGTHECYDFHRHPNESLIPECAGNGARRLAGGGGGGGGGGGAILTHLLSFFIVFVAIRSFFADVGPFLTTTTTKMTTTRMTRMTTTRMTAAASERSLKTIRFSGAANSSFFPASPAGPASSSSYPSSSSSSSSSSASAAPSDFSSRSFSSRIRFEIDGPA